MAAPRGGRGRALMLARANTPEQRQRVGDQAGGRLRLFLYARNFRRDHARMPVHGERFLGAPHAEVHGAAGVFEDFYGNRRDLLQPAR